MLKSDVIQHFGGVAKAARALSLSRQAIYQWDEIIPRGSAYIAQIISGGALTVDPAMYPPKVYLSRKKLGDARDSPC